MLKVKNYYPNLINVIKLKLNDLIKEDFTVSILGKKDFNKNFQWIEVSEKTKFTISSYDSNYCLDSKLELFYYLYNLNPGINYSLDISSNLDAYTEMFTVSIFKANSTQSLLFKFYIGLAKKDLKLLSLNNSLTKFEYFPLGSLEKVLFFSNFSSLKLDIGQTLNISNKNLFLKKGKEIFKVKKFYINDGMLAMVLGDKMEDKVSLGLEVQRIEIGFRDFNQLNIGSELEVERNDIKEIVIKVGESSFALASVKFNENSLSLRVKDLL